MGSVEIPAYLAALDHDGGLLADAAERAGLAAAVPGCPGWQVRDLVRHQAYVHGWAARHVSEQLPELIDGPDEAGILAGGPPDVELIAAYRRGHAALVATLRTADSQVACATFMPAPSPLAFWARRQAHETAVHCYDARSAGPGGPPDPVAAFEPAFAADGIDELIMCFTARRRYRLRGDGTHSLAVRPSDAPERWQVRLAAGRTEVSREEAGDGNGGGGQHDADCVLDGPAAGLYAFLWNRCDPDRGGVTVSGDPSILAPWSASVRVTY
jgi:uncharacterized protein (TIGR03083 family)